MRNGRRQAGVRSGRRRSRCGASRGGRRRGAQRRKRYIVSVTAYIRDLVVVAAGADRSAFCQTVERTEYWAYALIVYYLEGLPHGRREATYQLRAKRPIGDVDRARYDQLIVISAGGRSTAKFDLI